MQTRGSPWSDQESDVLRTMFLAGSTDKEIAANVTAQTGVPRTKDGVRGMRRKLHLDKPKGAIVAAGTKKRVIKSIEHAMSPSQLWAHVMGV